MGNEDKQTFAERHPKLNALLGLIILIIGIVLVSLLLKFIWENGILLFKWLISKASKVDAVIVVALITGGVSIFTVIFSSVISKIIEYKQSKRDYLSQKREKPYGEFVEMVYKIQQNGKNNYSYSQKEMINDISKFSKQLTLWGSKKVVNRWVQFREISTTPTQGAENLFILEDIMNEMRKDLGTKKSRKGNLLAFFVNDIKDYIK